MPKLIFTTPDNVVIKYDLSLERRSTTIGRGEDNKICINHPSVSHNHARLDRVPGAITITDLNSTNGVVANHVLYYNIELKKNMDYRIGEVRFRCEFTPSEEVFLAKERTEVDFIRTNPV